MVLPALAAVALFEGVTLVHRYNERGRLYAEAQQRAAQLQRPLVVVGTPNAGGMTAVFGAPYGCGDLCVDLNGCPECAKQAKVDLTRDRIPLADNSGVVFISCVLEYVDDINTAWAEIKRVAGIPQNIFMAIVGGGTLTSYMFPGAKWILTQASDGFTAHRISNDPRDGSSLK